MRIRKRMIFQAFRKFRIRKPNADSETDFFIFVFAKSVKRTTMDLPPNNPNAPTKWVLQQITIQIKMSYDIL